MQHQTLKILKLVSIYRLVKIINSGPDLLEIFKNITGICFFETQHITELMLIRRFCVDSHTIFPKGLCKKHLRYELYQTSVIFPEMLLKVLLSENFSRLRIDISGGSVLWAAHRAAELFCSDCARYYTVSGKKTNQ